MNDRKLRKYGHLIVPPFEFIDVSQAIHFKNELEFMYFFMFNEWFHRKLGIRSPYRGCPTPDIYANIIGTDLKIGIELEFNAINFKSHKHNPWYIDLIFSYIRKRGHKMIKGIPVWSVYEYDRTSNIYRYCLDDDVSRLIF